MTRDQIARQLGVQRANVNRFLRDSQLRSSVHTDPALREAICAVYALGGRAAVQAAFPGVKWRAFVDRHYDGPPRMIPWTPAQRLEAIRMGFLVTQHAQARYFGRPNAFNGSIRSLWSKTLRCDASALHGLSVCAGWEIVQPGCPITLRHQHQRPGPGYVFLWLDILAWLRPDVPEDLRTHLSILARWQAWLFGTEDPNVIRQFIAEREAYGYATDRIVRSGQSARDRAAGI